jgi:hypothetical protein
MDMAPVGTDDEIRDEFPGAIVPLDSNRISGHFHLVLERIVEGGVKTVGMAVLLDIVRLTRSLVRDREGKPTLGVVQRVDHPEFNNDELSRAYDLVVIVFPKDVIAGAKREDEKQQETKSNFHDAPRQGRPNPTSPKV